MILLETLTAGYSGETVSKSASILQSYGQQYSSQWLSLYICACMHAHFTHKYRDTLFHLWNWFRNQSSVFGDVQVVAWSGWVELVTYWTGIPQHRSRRWVSPAGAEHSSDPPTTWSVFQLCERRGDWSELLPHFYQLKREYSSSQDRFKQSDVAYLNILLACSVLPMCISSVSPMYLLDQNPPVLSWGYWQIRFDLYYGHKIIVVNEAHSPRGLKRWNKRDETLNLGTFYVFLLTVVQSAGGNTVNILLSHHMTYCTVCNHVSK